MKILLNLKKRHWLNSINDIRPVAAFLTIISVLIYISGNDLINRDGILYLKAAHAFVESGTDALLELYKWPFYPFLIAITGKFLSIPLINAAYLWNIIFAVIIVISFMSIVKEVNPSILLQLFSMLIVIGHPKIHHWQKYIIRDNGYWAFFLVSIFFIIKFIHTNKWKAFIAGYLSLCIATLFRIEGIIFILFYPLIIILRQEPYLERIKKIIFVYSILSILGFICYTKGIYESTRLKEISIYVKSLSGLTEKLYNKSKIATEVILSKHAKKWGTLFVISGFFGIFIYKLIITVSPLHLLLSIYSIRKKLIPSQIKMVIFPILIITLLPPIFFLYNSFFLSYRFLMPVSLLMLIFTPFALKRIYDNMEMIKNKILKIFNGIVILVFLILFMGAFMPPKQSKVYIKEAAIWIKSHLPEDSTIYSSSYVPELSYYSAHKVKKIDKKIIKKGDYVILRKKKIFKDLYNGDLYLLRCFSNKEGRHICIFKCE